MYITGQATDSAVHPLTVALDTTVGVLMGEAAVGDLAEQDQVFFRNYQELKLDTKKRLSRIMDAQPR